MEATCTVQVQDNVDAEASEIIQDCLRNALVVGNIMKNISNAQLLKLSLVNKLWNYEARCAIRKRAGVVARLDRNGSCPQIQAFARILCKMTTVVPFCGIRIRLPEQNPCECGTSLAPDLNNDVLVFDPLPFKSLSVEPAAGKWWNRCLLAKKVLRHVCRQLEELTLQMPFAEDIFISDFVQEECSFPRLRILKLKETYRRHVTGEEYVDCVKALIIARAPNLKELHSDRPLPDLLALVEGSSVVPVCSYQISAPFHELSQDLMNSALSLEKIRLVCTTSGRRFDFHRFHRILPILLQSSCTRKLSHVTVDAVLAVPLMGCGMRLGNVRKLTMCMNPLELKLRKLL